MSRAIRPRHRIAPIEFHAEPPPFMTLPAHVALIATLTERLRAGPSATAVLEAWCAARGLSRAELRAERLPGPETAPTDAQRYRLALTGDAPSRHRRVRLVCGPHVLSIADNWYVAARLTPAMNHALAETDVPFGRVVHALAPMRRTLAVRTLYAAAAPPSAAAPLFSIAALLATPDGVPFCEVEEVYLGAVLGGTA